MMTLGVQLGINYWNRLFYDALDKRDGAALLHGVFLALGLVAAAAAIAVALVHARMRLQIKWRGWLTKRLIGYWLADRRFYQMSVVENEGSNPEFRITDDTRLATEPIVDFAIGLATAVLTAAAFVGILWSVGGTITIPVGGGISIPGYMVIAAFAYSGVASISTLIISRTLVHRVAEKNEGEAELSYDSRACAKAPKRLRCLGATRRKRNSLASPSTLCWINGSRSPSSRRGSPGSSTAIRFSHRLFRCCSARRNICRKR
jgi:putative ATP-binding cassette transporter